MNYALLVVIVDKNSEYAADRKNFYEKLNKNYFNNETRITIIFIGNATIYRSISGQKLDVKQFPPFKDESSRYSLKDIFGWIFDAKSNINNRDPSSVATAIIVDVSRDYYQYKGTLLQRNE
ncbi:MAG: hypothetical protein LBU51_07315 [Bacteroidales bacterium]|jgi:hypothetical protein|nr:hypothetical protein [Bacteroidales bacterium]